MDSKKKQIIDETIDSAFDSLENRVSNISRKLDVLDFPIDGGNTDLNPEEILFNRKQVASAFLRGFLDGYCIEKPYVVSKHLKQQILSGDEEYPFFDVENGKERYKVTSMLLDDLRSSTQDYNDAVIEETLGFAKFKNRFAGIPNSVDPNERKKSVLKALNAFKNLADISPKAIEQQLKAFIIGQDDLVKQVSIFLHYHALKILNPQLNFPMRNLLIAGPSGCGKTEIWRVAKKLYDIPVQIVNSAEITSEGFSGDRKFSNTITADNIPGTIFVFDEFDKLCEPRHSSYGDNISQGIISELLKYIEGDSIEQLSNHGCTKKDIDTSKFGYVFIGTFQSIFDTRKLQQESAIGFVHSINPDSSAIQISDEELLKYGMRNELIGRLSIRCVVRALDEDDYLKIAQNPNSRIEQLKQSLCQLYPITDTFTEEKLRLYAKEAMNSDTGVRGFLNRLENEIVEQMYSCDTLAKEL